VTTYNSINNAAARGTRNLILGIGAGNTTYDAGCENNLFIGPFSGVGLTSNAANNVGLGYASLTSVTTGSRNCGYGVASLITLINGSFNYAFGNGAGSNYISNESSNIVIGNPGVLTDSHKIRIGQSGSSDDQQDDCYIAGISTNSVTDTTGLKYVTVNTSTDNIQCVEAFGTKTTFYDTPGNFLWTKDSRTKYVKAYGWNGGAGGGSGRKDASSHAGGGAGGSGGSCFIIEGPSSFFDATADVVVASGGIGAPSVTVSGNDGNTGGDGGVSFFGFMSVPQYVPGGAGGLDSTDQTAANGNRCVTQAGFFAQAGKGGTGKGLGNGGNGVDGGLISGNILIPTGGGGGAGDVLATAYDGGAGGNMLTSTGTNFVVGGVQGFNNNTQYNGGVGHSAPTGASAGGVMFGGTGGGGGTAPGMDFTITVAGAGGKGGFPGGGGGGGSAGVATRWDSGPGGAGGDGRVIVIEFF